MKFIVESTSITHGFTTPIPPPQRRLWGLTVRTYDTSASSLWLEEGKVEQLLSYR